MGRLVVGRRVVGLPVGLAEGGMVGATGALVGDVVGDAVGLAEGGMVGATGALVGELEGDVVGTAEGGLVGGTGALVGEIEGDPEGAAVGGMTGAFDGELEVGGEVRVFMLFGGPVNGRERGVSYTSQNK